MQSHTPESNEPAAVYALYFRSLFNPGRGFTFPCDARGCVDLDGLGDRQRESYLFARAVVGREYAAPEVVRVYEAA
jgi:hypothetical protein